METDPDTYFLVPMARYFITDHLGSTRVIINPDGTIHGRADYLPYGKFLLTTGAWRENNDYLWTGKEQLTPFFEANWYDSGARYLFTNGLFASLDPLAEKYPGISPYAYCAGDPVNRVDPDGSDPIYASSLFGRIKHIGDDGNDLGAAYLVQGKVKREVINQMKMKGFYSGDLSVSRNVMHIPSRTQINEIVVSINDTLEHGKENGGHAKSGTEGVSRWDQGQNPEIIQQDGTMIVKASIAPFVVNGEKVSPQMDSIDYMWHVHPNVSIGGYSLGASVPSNNDMQHFGKMEKAGYSVTAFVVGARDKRVSFYDAEGSYKTISLEQLLKIY